jgi:hypothetical protein
VLPDPRASSSTSAAMRPVTARTRARPAATTARSGQPAAGRRLAAGGCSSQRPGARASLRTAAASSPHRIAGRRWCPGRRPPRNRDVPGQASPPPAAHPAPQPAHPGQAPATIWCTREGDSPAAAASLRIEISSARAETSARTRSRSACSSRHPARETRGQDSPLAPARLDPLADRHPPILPSAFRKLDAVAVLAGPLLPAPQGGKARSGETRPQLAQQAQQRSR